MLLRFSILAFVLMTTSTFAQTMPPIETGVSQSLAKWRSANYSDVRYKLNLTLEKGAPLMKGTIEIRVKLTDEGAKNDLILDWRTTQFANDKDKPFANVVAVNDAQDILVSMPNEHIRIPKGLLKTGENFIKINFASPIKTSGAAVTRYVDKEDNAEYVYSLFVPSDASTALPVFDQPDLKARFHLITYTPDPWKVISNADALDYTSTKIGWTNTNFDETKPISPYVFAFAAGDFAEVSEPSAVADGLTRQSGNSKINRNASNKSTVLDAKLKPPATAGGSDLSQPSANAANDLPMKIYVRKSQAEKFKQHAAEVFRLNREGIKYLEDWFDYKFPFPKYDLVLIPEFPFGGMEHAGATFLREDRVIFPTEPTKNDYITRANVIFHEAAHQWFGDTVTMKWFDDLWLKEGFAEFMAYKTLAKVMPEYNAWKIFYERNKQAAYLTDVTPGTTPIYQEIPNLSAAKSAYGNIVYRKAPSFLRQAEFYLGEKEFQTAVRQFLKKHEFANAEWTDLVKEFELASKRDLQDWGEHWIKQRGVSVFRMSSNVFVPKSRFVSGAQRKYFEAIGNLKETSSPDENQSWLQKSVVLFRFSTGATQEGKIDIGLPSTGILPNGQTFCSDCIPGDSTDYLGTLLFVFPNYQDYGYGIFLLDEKSRAYVLENIQTEKDDFLRSMMWGSLWDSVRFYELAPEDYVKLVIKNINVETDESTIQSLLGRVSTAMNYYLSEPSAVADGITSQSEISKENRNSTSAKIQPSATADGSDLRAELEKLLINKIETASSVGQKITYFRALQNIGSSEQTKRIFKDLLTGKSELKDVELKTKDKFDLVTRLIVLGDKDAMNLLAELEKTETNDAAKRYAYAAKAGIATKENKAKYWNDFVNNKEISESYIESAFSVWNSPKHAELTLPYLEKALAELPNLKKNRKIFFVNGWLSSFIGGQKSAEALNIVNKFLAENPNLDKDLRLKILENADNLERAVKIREKYGK